ncbi:hypothetical protein C8J57DRAFT_1082787, partial [Mycena rebaudengoi]
FPVTKSILAVHSTVFRDMAAFPQPTAVSTEAEMIEGSPVVQLHDAAADVEVFLPAIFDSSSYLMPPPEYGELHILLGVLRLSHKYDVQYLFRRALSHLARAYYASSLAEYLDVVPERINSTTSTLSLIVAAKAMTEVGALWLLPIIYFSACRGGTKPLVEARRRGADEHHV